MSEEQRNETFTFQAEVQQLLNLVIHSLYSEREVFLRELISNASDACGRLRFESISNPSMRESELEPSIDIEINKKGKTIRILDNGIGMTHDEVVENIGTIARSGTKRFVEALSGEQSEVSRLIGQFGVGFYSAFMVADKVLIYTRKAGQPAQEGVKWESDGVNGYSIEYKEIEQHGTEIVLTLRKKAKEFLDLEKVKGIIKKYSDHVSLPIRVRYRPTKKKQHDWETANEGAALWTRAKNDITDEEYDNFYSALSLDYEKPLLRLHNRVEGSLEYSTLLFVPARAPFDLWDNDRRRGVKLYVKRVFIMDDTENLLPMYLRFIRGVIDSDDLPLNVSREFLQKNKKIQRIRSGTVRKVLNELKRIANNDSEKYQTFWNEFGKVVKEGITEDPKNRQRIAELLRFATTKSANSEQTVSLSEYVERMHDKQDAIYYITAENHAAAAGSPHLEVLKKHDIEVLLMSEPVDEWVVMHLRDFSEKPLKSIAKGDLTLDWLDDAEEAELVDEKLDSLVDRLKEVLSGSRHGCPKIIQTDRLSGLPGCQ